MRQLKNLFIPSTANNYRPHALRRPVVVAVLVFVIALELVVVLPLLPSPESESSLAAVSVSTLVDLTNKQRTSAKLPELKISQTLTKAAEAKAADMAARGYFSHNDPDGSLPWKWLKQAGYEYSLAGENLAVSFVNSEDVVKAWLNSPTHRANLMRERFTEMGIGVAKGKFEDKESIFVVQFFGRPPQAGVPQGSSLVAMIAMAFMDSPEFANRVLQILLIFFSLAFILNIFLNHKVRSTDIVINGLIIIAVIGGILWFNYGIDPEIRMSYTEIPSYLTN